MKKTTSAWGARHLMNAKALDSALKLDVSEGHKQHGNAAESETPKH